MHIVIILVLLLIIVFLLSKVLAKPQASTAASSTTSNPAISASLPALPVAFIANGNLFYKPAHGQVQQIHSSYVQEMADKVARSRERNAWKKGTSFEVSANREVRRFDTDEANIFTTAAYLDDRNTLLYFLADETMGGLFSYQIETGVELRIVHRQNLRLSDMAVHPFNGKILASSLSNNGSANIAILEQDGSRYQEVTGGDTQDSAPIWVPGQTQQIIFQSAGIARNEQGYIVAFSHVSLQKLDLASGQISALADDTQFDFLLPRFDLNGNLLFIRRPYEAPKYGTSNALLDTLYFPFRLLRAVFHYLNFFSMMYSRKPLTSASGPRMNADLKEILLKGKRIDAEQAMRKEAQINGVASLVPASWQLICRAANGSERVLAQNVASFDIMGDGRILYSNGKAVFLLDANGQSSLVLKSDLVSEVIAQKTAVANEVQ